MRSLPLLLVLASVAPARAQQTVVVDEPVVGELVRPEASAAQDPPSTSDPRLADARRLADRSALLRARAADALGASSNDAERARELERRAREAALAAIAAIDRIDASAPVRARAEALWLRVYLLDVLERGAEAVADAQRLVELCPRCREAANAYVRIGEHAFERADLRAALDAYRRAIATPGIAAELRAFALYKIGWSQLNLADFPASWAAFDEARRAAPAGAPIAREAARDQIHVLVRLDVRASDAVARVRAFAPDAATASRLAERYADQLRDVGRAPDAAAFERAWASAPSRSP